MKDLKPSTDADASYDPNSLETSEINDVNLAAKSVANDMRKAVDVKRYSTFKKDTPKRRASDKKD
jgi:hypothetical protein